VHLNLTALGDGSVGGGLGAHATYGHTAAADQDDADDRKHDEDKHAEDDDDKEAGGQARSVDFPRSGPKVACVASKRTKYTVAGGS